WQSTADERASARPPGAVANSRRPRTAPLAPSAQAGSAGLPNAIALRASGASPQAAGEGAKPASAPTALVPSAPLAAAVIATSAASPESDAAASAATKAHRKTASSAPRAKAAEVPTVPLLGVVQLALSPWGQVEVDGQALGTSPPLSRLTLTAGTHTVTVRNADFPPFTTTLQVDGENPVTLRHRFGP
ncbi:MAG TPA: hypothetical protein VH328_04010, partial [Burkholderiaceae bacterium]|nr:hypothetical protein [Burkholderiaceae bacterium]